MDKISIKEFFKSIILNIFSFFMAFGWIILIIAYMIFKNSNIEFFYIIVIFFFILFIIALIDEINEINRILINKTKEINDEKENLKKIYMEERRKLINIYNNSMNRLNLEKEEFNKIINDEKIYKPYLATMLANYNAEIDELRAKMLETKKRPAIKAKEEVTAIKNEKQKLIKKLKIKEHQLLVYESLFPWLEEFKEIPENEINKIINSENLEGHNRVKDFLSPEEYENLSNSEKYQLWLDRYKAKKNKSNWEIGIEFERFVGYKYESKGYKLIYNGAREGLEDLGRDLIAIKGKEMLVIQCKNWSKSKMIHEKHIFQLYGTMVLKSIEEPNMTIKGVFICTTKLSETARKISKYLNIEILEEYKYDKDYPCIKCNISRKDGSKIYHLPFNQQYDTVNVEKERGECYVHTVEEAENLGFRKAMKHNFYK